MARSILAAIVFAAMTVACSHRELRPSPEVMAAASPELLERLRTNPHSYFRIVGREWTSRVCEIFAGDLPDLPTVQLHGDPHVEQYALMKDAWGLDDFDDSARGPAIVDILRFLGSIELAAHNRGWTRDRDRLFDQFFAGYRRGLSEPFHVPPQPGIVRRLKSHTPPLTREAFLAWAEQRMLPMAENALQGVHAAMKLFGSLVQYERPDLTPDYFTILRAGWLRIGIGSAVSKKVLMRVRGRSADPADDVILEAKALRGLEGVGCLEVTRARPTFRVIVGNQQIGRLKHDILMAGPELPIPGMAIEGVDIQNWWIRSWESSYREISISDLASVEELSEIIYDSGVQLGAGSVHRAYESPDRKLQSQSLGSIARLESRIRQQAGSLVQELLRGWHDLGGREAATH